MSAEAGMNANAESQEPQQAKAVRGSHRVMAAGGRVPKMCIRDRCGPGPDPLRFLHARYDR